MYIISRIYFFLSMQMFISHASFVYYRYLFKRFNFSKFNQIELYVQIYWVLLGFNVLIFYFFLSFF